MPDDVDFLMGPTPHQDAIDFIKSKPVVARDVFDGLLPELKARAFTIAGLEGNANVMQAIRDRIAELPAGHDWNAIKKNVADDLTPFLVDPDEQDPDKRDAQINAAYRRAELLLRTHGFQAYQAASYQVMDRQRDVQPFWQYLTMEDERVRPEHAALDKLILPANDPFWQTHFPPWDYGCRCQAVPISQEERDDQHAKDQKVSPDQRLVCEPVVAARLNQGQLTRDGRSYDVRPPTQKEGGTGFSWDPSSLRLPIDKLKARYDAQTWAEFETWARKTELNASSDKTVWELAGGKASLGRRIKRAAVSLWNWMTGVSIFPAATPSTFDQLVAQFTAQPGTMTEAEAGKFIESMEKTHGVAVTDKTSITVEPGLDPAWTAYIDFNIQEFFKLIPKQVLDALPKFETKMLATLADDSCGSYNMGTKILKLNARQLNGRAQLISETIFHELAHWIHLHGPVDYRKQIADHFKARTSGERVKALLKYPGLKGKKDQFWDEYLGLVKSPFPDGVEIPTMAFELLTNPGKLAQLYNDPIHRETIREAFSILF